MTNEESYPYCGQTVSLPPEGYTLVTTGVVLEGDLLRSIAGEWIPAEACFHSLYVAWFKATARAALPGDVEVGP